MKIFVIGFNKTATTTFHILFQANGRKSYHGKQWVANFHEYDCFSDIDSQFDMLEHYTKFPDAIYILNTRKLKDWIRSRFQYAKQYNMKWGTPPSVELATKWIQMWEAKYTQILAFFQDKPSKLILVNIDIPNWMEFVSNILEFEKKEVQSINVSPIINDSTIVQVLKDTFDTLGYSEEKQNAVMIESTLINLYRNNF